MTMKKVLSLSFVLLCICACNNIWEEDFISNPINADENLLAAYFLKSYEEQYGIVWQESNVLPEHTLLTDYIELRYNGHNERYQYVIPALNGDNHLIDAYVVYPVNAVGDGLDKNLGRELGEMEFVDSSCICSLPFHEKFGHSYYFLDWKEKGLDVQEGLYAYAKQICDYTKELVRADTLPSTKAYGETYTVSIEYELEPCTWVEGNEVFVSVPRPETVKQIILSCFDFYGTVVASREYTVRCRFHFMIQGNISEATLDLAMWDADSRLRREFGVCFLYYSADLSKMGGSSGSGSSSDSGTHIGGGGGSSNPGKNPDPPEGDDDITKNNFLEKVMTPQFKQKIRDELGVNPDKIPILLGSDLIHNAQTNMAYYSVDGNIHVYDECFTRGYSWDDMEAIMYHEYVHAKQHLVDVKSNVKNSQFATPLFEFSGACSGCGETPYVKLISQLFGDREMVSNATGCSSIYSGSVPSTPYTTNEKGHGPACANSLFEDFCEFGLGMTLAHEKMVARIEKIMTEVAESDSPAEFKAACAEWLAGKNDADASRAAADKLIPMIEANKDKCPFCARLDNLKNHLVKRSQWIIGGDGASYDIGFGGLDHVIASGKNVNILVLDTEVYSNTGGQASKATPLGAIAKFAAAGKRVRKKDLGLIASTYGSVYVAQVAMGADQAQTLKAIREAEAYDGPSVIIAYAPCINHGLKKGMGKSQAEEAAAVECGYWHLWRYNPELEKEGKNPFTLDSKEPNWDNFESFLKGEVRYASVMKHYPAEAEELYAAAKANAQWRYNNYRRLALQQWGQDPDEMK